MLTTSEILIDTSIIVHSLNKDSFRHSKAVTYLSRLAGQPKAVTHQNIMEAYRVLTHPKHPNPMTKQQALDALKYYVDNCRVISPTEDTFKSLNTVMASSSVVGNKIMNAYLVATIKANSITKIATFNKRDWEDFVGIEIIDLETQA
ncbi:MAG: type II toxin-antitoxin system VapC family toxin [Patescibacteria group bacterium]|uniref:Type II toxin-antitoxin system VapC family toxin n=1 Tax=candidate division WWE3 bacterium TaxID=2053526 RepID=A0A955J281_UNCKA|nr:type II toxin-antitoxin system VapC family toxin [candidate division WWE3 bacterium]